MASKSRGGRDLMRGGAEESKLGSSPKHVNFPPDAGLAKIIPRSPEADEYALYQAMYDYNSGDPDDLAFSANDILQVTDEGDGSPQTWMFGRRQTGEEGHFPSTYVRKINSQAKRTFNIDMLDEDEPGTAQPAAPKASVASAAAPKAAAATSASVSATKATTAATTATATAASSSSNAKSKSASAAAAIAASQPERAYALYQALYDYNSGDDGDLVFQANDILRVFDEGDGPSSWMEGETQDGRSGTFPGTYVRKMNTSRRTVSIKGLEHTQ